jgi:orotate phosphoribosyltransferase
VGRHSFQLREPILRNAHLDHLVTPHFAETPATPISVERWQVSLQLPQRMPTASVQSPPQMKAPEPSARPDASRALAMARRSVSGGIRERLHNWIDSARASIHSEAIGITRRRGNTMAEFDAAKKARLKEIIAARSFRDGVEITLASGKTSDFYFNLKPTMMHPEGAALLADAILDAVEPYAPDYIGGLEMGAVPLVAFVSPQSHRRGQPLPAFFVRKEVKGHGTGALIEGLGEGESLQGKRVVIMEDVTTTGGSAMKAARSVMDAGGEVVLVLTVIDREDGATQSMNEEAFEFGSIYSVSDFR